MKIQAKIPSVDTSSVSSETTNEQSSVSSTPASVNLGIGRTQDGVEANKPSLLDSMLIPKKPKIPAILAAIPAALQEALDMVNQNKQPENPGNVFKGDLIGTAIGKAIGDSGNDGDDAAKKSGENERRSNSITSKD